MNKIPKLDYKQVVHDELSACDLEQFAEITALFKDDILLFSNQCAANFEIVEKLDIKYSLNKRQAFIVAFLHYSTNSLLLSTKLLIQTYLSASGNMVRQSLEALAMAVICTDKDAISTENLEKDRFSAKDIINRIDKTFVKKGIAGPSVPDMHKWRELYNKYSHSSYRNFVTILSLSNPGCHIVGSMYDPRQRPQYHEEFTNRISIAAILPQYTNAIELILAKDLP